MPRARGEGLLLLLPCARASYVLFTEGDDHLASPEFPAHPQRRRRGGCLRPPPPRRAALLPPSSDHSRDPEPARGLLADSERPLSACDGTTVLLYMPGPSEEVPPWLKVLPTSSRQS